MAGAGPETRAHAPRELRVGDGRGGIAKRMIGNFAAPTYVTHAPGAPRYLYVVETGGRVRVLHNGNLLGQPFLDIHGRVSTGGERGLLSIAFDPHYRRNHRLYAYYTNRAGNIEIDEFRARSNRNANEGSRRRVIVIRHPGFANHNGGQLQFGPDGKLYIGTGDGGGAGDPRENAQDKGELLGKLLRINPHRHGSRPYRSPRGNPYVGRPGQNEIYARGLRNPYRFAFDRGRIVLGDVGQDRWEEVNYETHRSLRGANFGWDRFEGDHRFDYPGDNEASRAPGYQKTDLRVPAQRPKLRVVGGCSIIGGLVVRQPQAGQPPRALPVRRLLRRPAAQLRRPPPPRQARQGAGGPRGPPELVRQGSRRANLRRLPGWPRVPARAQVATSPAARRRPSGE